MAPSTFWQDRLTLVTGATGFAGGWVVRKLLEHQADVVCLIRDWIPDSELIGSDLLARVKTVRGDLKDQAGLERLLGEYEINTVLHLGAQTIVGVANANPVSTFESNIAGTWSILEACRRSPKVKQIVIASSDKAYGDTEHLPYDEATPLSGKHPYDVSKSCADLIAQSYATTYDLPVAITRCGNFYGPGDLNWNRIVPGTIRSVLRGERPVIRSDGQYIRDYLYVEDAATAYLLLAEKLAANAGFSGEAFNFSNETRVTVLELTHKIIALMDSHLEPDVRGEAHNEILFQSLSAMKAWRELGWRPRFTLEEGLRKTISWYKDFLERKQS
jgi:CDP-glucose 4,6-dehydratase